MIIACALGAMALPPIPAPPVGSITASAVRIARQMAVVAPTARQTAANEQWNDVRRLRDGHRIQVRLQNGDLIDGRLSHVMDDRIVLRPGPDTSTGTEISRDAIAEIRRRTHGAWAGGLVGLGVGGVLGLGTALSIGLSQCGASCADEHFLAPLSLFGMPVVGAALGATVMSPFAWTTVYHKP